MQPGSIIYDLAAIQGGNTAFTEVDKIIDKNGVKIMGESNILNKCNFIILGGVQIQPVATPAPVEGGSLGEAQVLIMLGTDLAGKLLPGALPAAPVDTTTTTVAPA